MIDMNSNPLKLTDKLIPDHEDIGDNWAKRITHDYTIHLLVYFLIERKMEFFGTQL